jgi:hypothetical protein
MRSGLPPVRESGSLRLFEAVLRHVVEGLHLRRFSWAI